MRVEGIIIRQIRAVNVAYLTFATPHIKTTMDISLFVFIRMRGSADAEECAARKCESVGSARWESRQTRKLLRAGGYASFETPMMFCGDSVFPEAAESEMQMRRTVVKTLDRPIYCECGFGMWASGPTCRHGPT